MKTVNIEIVFINDTKSSKEIKCKTLKDFVEVISFILETKINFKSFKITHISGEFDED